MPVVPKPRTIDEQVAEIWEMLRKLKRTGITGQTGQAGLTGATGAAGPAGPAGPPGSFATPTPTTPARVFNTTFQPSLTRVVFCLYTVRIFCDDGETGEVILRTDAASPPTYSPVSARHHFSVTGLIGVTGTSSVDIPLSYLVRPGDFVRLDTVNTVGTPTFTLVRQSEEIL